MALDTLDKLIDAMANRRQQALLFKQSFAAATNLWSSHWRATGIPCQGGIPTTTPATCDSATPGAMPFSNPTGGRRTYITRAAYTSNVTPSLMRIVDRLAHVGGLVGNVATVQTFASGASLTLPARAGTGEGVEIWVEWYTATGATNVNLSVTYTNSQGVGGRVGTAASIGVSVAAQRIIPATLQTGDTGVQSVESIQLSASTGTAGNVGVTLVKRVLDVPFLSAVSGCNSYGPAELNMPEVVDDACLFGIQLAAAPTSSMQYLALDLCQG